MKHSTMTAFMCAALACAALGTAIACGGDSTKTPPAPAPKQRPEPPEDFKNKSNPLVGKPEAVEAGKALFTTAAGNCFTCHGPEGRGDGAAGKGLPIAPGNLRDKDLQAMSDGYLFFRITEGGAAIGSAMPAHKHLTDDQRWQLVAFIRSLGVE